MFMTLLCAKLEVIYIKLYMYVRTITTVLLYNAYVLSVSCHLILPCNSDISSMLRQAAYSLQYIDCLDYLLQQVLLSL